MTFWRLTRPPLRRRIVYHQVIPTQAGYVPRVAWRDLDNPRLIGTIDGQPCASYKEATQQMQGLERAALTGAYRPAPSPSATGRAQRAESTAQDIEPHYPVGEEVQDE